MTRVRNGLALGVTATFLVACGSGGTDASDERSPAGDDTNGASETSLTDTDVQIVDLVLTGGGRLDLTATQFFSDVDVKALKAGAEGGLDVVAPTRARIGDRLQTQATQAGEALANLAGEASDTTTEVVHLADTAFAELADCGTEAGAAWTSVVEGNVDVPAMLQADRTCKAARAAYARAEGAVDELPEAPAESTTGKGAAAGEEVRVVLGTSSGTQANEVVQPVAPGATVSVILDGRNTSSFLWELQRRCDGPLTFDVTLLISSDGTLAVDPSESGYSASDPPTKPKAPASIKGQERFQLEVGTFTIGDDASGNTRIVVTLANGLCPDPQTGGSFTPTSIGPSPSDALVLEVAE